jgi:hypothetical protein
MHDGRCENEIGDKRRGPSQCVKLCIRAQETSDGIGCLGADIARGYAGPNDPEFDQGAKEEEYGEVIVHAMTPLASGPNLQPTMLPPHKVRGHRVGNALCKQDGRSEVVA